jgi:hypothetical protein
MHFFQIKKLGFQEAYRLVKGHFNLNIAPAIVTDCQ